MSAMHWQEDPQILSRPKLLFFLYAIVIFMLATRRWKEYKSELLVQHNFIKILKKHNLYFEIYYLVMPNQYFSPYEDFDQALNIQYFVMNIFY